ncbi:mycofactocin-associated electron transfer flavoprotein alpha subunit [Amycolatopsis sp. H20-H5]|uniref:mycofactocin-associated electron transfer flavoprotein alpha subunit n=1 Tax=Amycolatopsis sp. H20-H5 TaxID=3046309 RepID=UPI002DB8587B|nr:mycofactocin-associated electron transfer flavoprotein alpha subunit [Amycolatopsis sp. H20-H5]MEC3977301.1 mycofactocin-associated electron transfer flavoprotein alpha subunit [Amycolatopsis sp. H20-H5]
MIAVIPVRGGLPPAGGDETVAEAGGEAILLGEDVRAAAAALPSLRCGRLAEAGPYAPGAWAEGLAAVLPAGESVVLPASPDGRDLAPRLAFVLGFPLLAGAVEVTGTGAALARHGSRDLVVAEVDGPFVATLIPGSRAAAPVDVGELTELVWVTRPGDAEVVEVLPPDPRTADLAEAPRILVAGAGLTRGGEPAGKDAVALLERVAGALSASVGATRVVTDAGFTGHQRQIGTTGVVVNPKLYVAFGVSGAAQHVGGLGDPEHVVSVNLDASCPMTALADLGLVTDATALLTELARRLEVTHD